MKTVFYSKDIQFELTEEEYNKALLVWNNGQKAFISRLGVSLSPLYIWAGNKPVSEYQSRKLNSDKQWCVDRFGNNDWRLENDQDVKVNLHYYPELRNSYGEEKKEYLGEGDSKFAKQLSGKLD